MHKDDIIFTWKKFSYQRKEIMSECARKSVVKLLYPSDVAVESPDDEYAFDEIYTIVVDGEGLVACETAFAIFNSHPDEMFCHWKYLGDVESFRNLGKRSMSVGDVLDVDGVRYKCANFGFEKMEVVS